MAGTLSPLGVRSQTTASSSRRAQNSLYTPSARQPVVDDVNRHVHFPRPLRPCFGLALVCHFAVSAVIVGLLEIGCPGAVFWGIGPVVVPPINRMQLRGPGPHVGIEGLERVPPPITDDNPAATIPFVRFSLNVVATLFHPAPDLVLRKIGAAVGRVVGSEPLHVEAAATHLPSGLQVAGGDGRLGSAIANAVPQRRSARHPFRTPQYQQPSETVSCEVLKSRHNRHYITGTCPFYQIDDWAFL